MLLVASAIMVEIPILMVVLSRTLKPATYWWTTVAAVTLTAVFIIGGGSTRPHYFVLATIELVLMALVVRQAWQWRARAGRSGATLGLEVDTSRP